MKHKFDQTVHYDIKGRKRYKRKMLIVFLISLIIILGCSVMFYFGNVKWDPNTDFKPWPEYTESWQIALVIVAAILSLATLVGAFVYCWFDINKFYRTQEEYWKSEAFAKAKKKALSQDLTKLDKKTLKWYKKLGYLTSQEKKAILEQQKNKTTRN